MNIIEKMILLPLLRLQFCKNGDKTMQKTLKPCNCSYFRVLLHYGSIKSHPIKFFSDNFRTRSIPINC